MADDFLAKFLGNPNRAKLLRVFVFEQNEAFTASGAAKRAGVKAEHAGKEIRALEDMGIIKKGKLSIRVGAGGKRVLAGKQKESAWTFNQESAHANALSKFVHEVSPVPYRNILTALRGSGRLAAVILSGTFMGDQSRPADLILAIDAANEGRLEEAVRSLEAKLGWEIRYAAFSIPEFRYRLTTQDRLLRDTLDYPHFVLLDRLGIL